MPKQQTTSSSVPPIGQRIRSVRGFSSLNRKAFGYKHGISEATLKSWEQADTTLREASFQRLLTAFKAEGIMCTKEWLLTGTGTPPYKLGNVTPSPSEEGSPHKGGDLLAEATFFLKNNPQAVVFQILDEGMEPFYSSGDYVGGILVHEDIPLKSHRPHLVTFKTGEKEVRTVFKEGDKYLLARTNPLYRHDQALLSKDAIHSFHEIVWHRRD